ncbi:MAG: helix-turn-helix transcriptional regulator [Clostridia bacterium]|nr:helix-turn-helix transcriptional regulator [Clostridia bacterium]
MIDYKLIGSRIKKARDQKGLTQEKLAEAANITVVYLSKIENGKVRPTLETLSCICDFIGCDIGALLGNAVTESKNYRIGEIGELFATLKPDVKPVAIEMMKSLKKLK